MFRRSTLLLCFLALAACSSENVTVSPSLTPGDALLSESGGIDGLDDGTYLVRFRGGIPSDFGARVAKLGGEVVFAHARAGVGAVRDLTPATAAELSASTGVDVAIDDAVAIDAEVGEVESAAFDAASPSSPAQPTLAAFFNRQWGMRAIQADAAWAAGRLGSATTKVGILDTGLDYLNPDLVGRVDLANSRSYLSAAENARVQAAFPGAHPVADAHFHGTHVGATVVSNGYLAAGVSSRITLVGFKVCAPGVAPAFNGTCPTSGTLQAILDAADMGLPVINMSLGGSFLRRAASARGGDSPSFIAVISDVFQYANSKGTVIVVSAGNAATDMQHSGNRYFSYCDAPHAVCVSATGPTSSPLATGVVNVPAQPWVWQNPDALAPYSNFGNKIHVAAPGGAGRNWLVTLPTGQQVVRSDWGWVYAACSGFTINPGLAACRTRFFNSPTSWGGFVLGVNGTSMAAPHVTGVAALIAAAGASSPTAIRGGLAQTADDLGTDGRDPIYGFGRVNALRASQ